MKHTLMTTLAVALAATACTSHPTTEAPRPDPAADAIVLPADDNLIPAGALIVAELNETLTTDMERGDLFTATVTEPLVAQTGGAVVPEGSLLTGLVTGTWDPDGVDEPGVIRLNITRIEIDGVTHPIAGDIVATDVDMDDHATHDMAQHAAAGAILGAIIGGEAEAALLGGALGVGAGTILSLGLGERGALPEGTEFTLRTTVGVDIGR